MSGLSGVHGRGVSGDEETRTPEDTASVTPQMTKDQPRTRWRGTSTLAPGRQARRISMTPKGDAYAQNANRKNGNGGDTRMIVLARRLRPDRLAIAKWLMLLALMLMAADREPAGLALVLAGPAPGGPGDRDREQRAARREHRLGLRARLHLVDQGTARLGRDCVRWLRSSRSDQSCRGGVARGAPLAKPPDKKPTAIWVAQRDRRV